MWTQQYKLHVFEPMGTVLVTKWQQLNQKANQIVLKLQKKNNAKGEQQMMADLPAARLQIFDPLFTHSGVDYFGPFHGKQGRSTVKRYGCVFTCMTTRAVHIEMAADMSSDCFLNTLRRFISRRKGVKHLYSDNGSNFTGAE